MTSLELEVNLFAQILMISEAKFRDGPLIFQNLSWGALFVHKLAIYIYINYTSSI